MKITLTIIQIFLSLILCTLIFIQSKGDMENSNLLSEAAPERRGWEKIIFQATILVIFLFLISSLAQLLA